MVKHSRATLIGKLLGMASLARNMRTEDAAIRRNLDDERNLFLGRDVVDGTKDAFDEDDGLFIVAGGDVTVGDKPRNPVPPTVAPPAGGGAPVVRPPSTSPVAQPINGLSPWKKLALGSLLTAAIGGPAAGLGYYIANRMKPAPQQPAAQAPSVNPSFGIGLLPPDRTP
jgi:hypothetical protein